ncbi:MAG: hypothetical protein V9F04_11635 [Dermatophilaceae bacterium]
MCDRRDRTSSYAAVAAADVLLAEDPGEVTAHRLEHGGQVDDPGEGGEAAQHDEVGHGAADVLAGDLGGRDRHDPARAVVEALEAELVRR